MWLKRHNHMNCAAAVTVWVKVNALQKLRKLYNAENVSRVTVVRFLLMFQATKCPIDSHDVTITLPRLAILTGCTRQTVVKPGTFALETPVN